ncbi:uncharacterized protein VB005_04918 [Metarhizium brunneum]
MTEFSAGNICSWLLDLPVQSRSPSPLKRQLMALRLDESGLEFRQLQIDEPPVPAAIDLLSDLCDIGNGIEILPEDLRISITNGLSISGPTAHAWRFSFRADPPPDLPGRIPSPKAIISVHRWAKKCHEAEHEEAAWGEEVYVPWFKQYILDGFRTDDD